MLFNVANGIFAAGKIGEAVFTTSNKRNEMHKANPLTSTCKILDILVQYAPEEKEVFGERQ